LLIKNNSEAATTTCIRFKTMAKEIVTSGIPRNGFASDSVNKTNEVIIKILNPFCEYFSIRKKMQAPTKEGMILAKITGSTVSG
jgi:hypothetical protein